MNRYPKIPDENFMGKQKQEKPVTERSLFYWAFGGNLKLQLILFAVIIFVVFARVLPLEMQKRIINDSIALRNLNGLITYSVIYLAAITTASGLKLAINYLQALIGERAMSSMRQELYNHILHLPLRFFRTTQPGMVVSSLITELSTAGTFAGMAFAVPITNVLTLFAFAGYLLWLNTKLAAATLVIYPIVVFVIPVLQKRANSANKKRVNLSRSTSSQITESISGIHEVQVHGAYWQEGRKFKDLIEELRNTRIRWSLFRFAIKTANNYFVGLGPFIIFIFGGYLVMHGQLELGAMVAFLSAQEKLFDPWKELIDFYQTYQDASIRYTRTMQHYNLLPDFPYHDVVNDNIKTQGQLNVENLIYETTEGTRLLSGISFSLNAGEHLAIVGFSGSGKSTLIQCIGKMYPYTAGNVKLDGKEVSSISKNEIIHHIGYVSQQPFIFTGTIRENLVYAYNASVESLSPAKKQNDNVDRDKLILVLQQVGLFVDVMRFGLDSHIESEDRKTAETIIRIRSSFKENFGERLQDFIEFYDPSQYHYNSSIAANITFGTSLAHALKPQLLHENNQFTDYLKSIGLFAPLLSLGVDLARQTVDLLAGLDSVDIFFKKSPVPADKIQHCEKILLQLKQAAPETLPEKHKILLLSFALQFTPSIHTMARISSELKEKILHARKQFPSAWENSATNQFVFYDDEKYIHGQSILNNILFGQIKPGRPKAQEVINQSIMHLLIEEDYLEQVAEFGLDFEVGNMGDRLSGGQRQKLAIARVLLKQPKVLLMDEATSALDNKSQARIQRLMATRWKGKRTVISVIHRLDTIGTFDKIAVTKAGKIVEFGSYNELLDQKGVLHELIYGRQ